jgi:hypothetical protein
LFQPPTSRINQSALDTTAARQKTRTTTMGADKGSRPRNKTSDLAGREIQSREGQGSETQGGEAQDAKEASSRNRNKRASSQREMKKIKSEKNVVARMGMA